MCCAQNHTIITPPENWKKHSAKNKESTKSLKTLQINICLKEFRKEKPTSKKTKTLPKPTKTFPINFEQEEFGTEKATITFNYRCTHIMVVRAATSVSRVPHTHQIVDICTKSFSLKPLDASKKQLTKKHRFHQKLQKRLESIPCKRELGKENIRLNYRRMNIMNSFLCTPHSPNHANICKKSRNHTVRSVQTPLKSYLEPPSLILGKQKPTKNKEPIYQKLQNTSLQYFLKKKLERKTTS